MLDESIKEQLLNLHSGLNFKDLIKFIEDNNIPITNKRLYKSYGMAAFDMIYLNMDSLMTINPRKLFFAICHEISHYKRMNKIGFKQTLANLSIDDFEAFKQHILYEEIVSDRYACKLFYIMNNDIYPFEETQRLTLKEQQNRYDSVLHRIYGVIQNDEEKYWGLIKSHILN